MINENEILKNNYFKLNTLNLDVQNRSLIVKTIDYILYFATFGGITFISGSIVHALEFSLFSVFLLVFGLIISPGATIIRDKLFYSNSNIKAKTPEYYLANTVASVSSGIVAGGILHWQESPRFGFYLVLSGLVMALTSNFLYSEKTYKQTLVDFFITLSMFSGISFISGSVVHAMNAWFSNFTLIFIGMILTPGALVIKQKMTQDKNQGSLMKNVIILVFLSLGIGGITGGILHFTVNVTYALKLIIGGIVISYSAALFKSEGSLADLRK